MLFAIWKCQYDPLYIGAVKCGQSMQPLPFFISHRTWQYFVYEFLKCIKEGEIERYKMENELPKMMVDLFRLMFMRGAP